MERERETEHARANMHTSANMHARASMHTSANMHVDGGSTRASLQVEQADVVAVMIKELA